MFGKFGTLKKAHEQLYMQMYWLITAKVFYDVLASEFYRDGLNEDEQRNIVGLVPREAASGFEWATFLMAYPIKNGNASDAQKMIYDTAQEVVLKFQGAFEQGLVEYIEEISRYFVNDFKGWFEGFYDLVKDENPDEDSARLAHQAISSKKAAKKLYYLIGDIPRRSVAETKPGFRELSKKVSNLLYRWSELGFFEHMYSQDESKEIAEERMEDALNTYNSAIDPLRKRTPAIYGVIKNLSTAFGMICALHNFKDVQLDLKPQIEIVLVAHQGMTTLMKLGQVEGPLLLKSSIVELSRIAELSDEEFIREITLLSVWVSGRVQTFSPELAIKFEAEAGKSDLKMAQLFAEFYSTPEEVFRVSDHPIKKMFDEPLTLKIYRAAIESFLGRVKPDERNEDVKRIVTEEVSSSHPDIEFEIVSSPLREESPITQRPDSADSSLEDDDEEEEGASFI